MTIAQQIPTGTTKVAGKHIVGNTMKRIAATVLALVLLLSWAMTASAQWTQLPKPGITASTMLLLTDGTVLCQDSNAKKWRKLTPDAFGSYVNGTWSDIADMTTPRLYYASAVLADGRVFIAGGEYTGGSTIVQYNQAQVYDPVANTWTGEVNPLGWAQVGDAAGTILADGRFIFGNTLDRQIAIFDPTVPWGAGAFTAAASKATRTSEENWVLLPDDSVFTVQTANTTGCERYLPGSNMWIPMANIPASMALVELSSAELGPPFLLPDGRVFYVGCTGNNALFVPGPLSTDLGSWIAAPDTLDGGGQPLGAKDAPGSWMPNGQVLITVGPVDGIRTNFLGPVSFFLYTPGGINDAGTMVTETAAPNAPSVPYLGRMLLLPSGQVLFTGESDDVYAYTYTSGGPDPSWKPRITSLLGRVEANQTYSIYGMQFNGVSQGANYGDDAEMGSNYPLIRVTNRVSGHVFYCRTHDHSTMGVATGDAIVSTFFDTPSTFEPGLADLVVVANGIPSDPIVINGPVLTIPGDVFFDDTCVGATNYATLYVCNTGAEDLQVREITSANPRFRVVTPSSSYPVVISPDFCFPFRVQFAPTAVGDQSTTFTVPSNDPNRPTNTVNGFGKGVGPTITTFIADAGSFGDVCLGSFRDLNLTINNAGGCTLIISNITSSSGQFLVPVVVNYPLVIHPGDSVAVPIRFQPTSLGPKAGMIIIASNDPLSPNRLVSVSGTVPPGDVRVTGSTDFGEVCAGAINEKTISICNVGLCNLLVSNVSVVGSCPDFVLVNNPFPAVVSHDFCVDVVIRFTPTSCGTKTCTLRIVTDDPDNPVINLTVTASTPCGSIDVPPDLAFEPEVIQTVGSCKSQLPFPISNTGFCPLVITAITLGGVNAGDFALSGLPSFPIILEAGHIVGEGDLNVVFAPTVVDRDRLATITVTYVVDPVAGTTASITRNLGGEGVRTGARVLVTHGGIPVAKVERIHLQRINANRNKDRLDTQDNVMNLLLTTVVPAAPVEAFQYHREYGTVSNPIQLLPGAYQVTATAIINGKRRTLVVGFDVQTCDFNPTLVVDF